MRGFEPHSFHQLVYCFFGIFVGGIYVGSGFIECRWVVEGAIVGGFFGRGAERRGGGGLEWMG